MKLQEKWLDITGYEGFYQISNLGKVRSIARTDRRNQKRPELLMKPISSGNGYLEFKLCKDGNCVRASLHRLMAIHFIPNPENKPQVNHIDGVKHNNILDNLEWVTHKENIRHAISKGLLLTRGEDNACSKLKTKDVLHIRSCGLTNKELATIYKVGPAHIGVIKKRKQWKQV